MQRSRPGWQKRLVGVSIAGELQPSHALVDLVNSMCDSNNVVWIPPSKCSKRETEITMATKEKSSMVSIEQELLKVSAAEPDIKTDTSTDLQWQWAMMRRGIAMDQCGLISWDTHQLWTQQLLSMLTKEVPTGYARLTLELVRADKELFTVMAQELQLTDKRLTATPAPMDESMKTLRTDPRITMCLLPELQRQLPKIKVQHHQRRRRRQSLIRCQRLEPRRSSQQPNERVKCVLQNCKGID